MSIMPHSLSAKQVIVVEDDNNDFQQIAHALRESGAPFAVRRVDAPDELDEELQRLSPDIVLCHHRSARHSGSILDRVHAFEPSLPVVVLSDAADQPGETELLAGGVGSFVRKQRLAGLGLAVERALRQHADEQRRRVGEIRQKLFGPKPDPCPGFSPLEACG
jgi:DNA-binding NtrC family response regulator